MGHSNSLQVFAYEQAHTLIVEPWAEEFMIRVGDRCRVVALHPGVVPSFGVEMNRDRLIVWVNEGGATFEFWRGEACEFSTPVPIPGVPHSS
jgi:hypothetical protein